MHRKVFMNGIKRLLCSLCITMFIIPTRNVQAISLAHSINSLEYVVTLLIYTGYIGSIGNYITCHNTEITRNFWLNLKQKKYPELVKKAIRIVLSPVMVDLEDSFSVEQKAHLRSLITSIHEKMGGFNPNLYLYKEPTTRSRCDSITIDTFAFSEDFFELSEEEQRSDIAYLCATVKGGIHDSDHAKVTKAALIIPLIGILSTYYGITPIVKEIFIKNSSLNSWLSLPGLSFILSTLWFTAYCKKTATQSYVTASEALCTPEKKCKN